MRGGRNKFGSYYKRDRAQRMQRIALRTNAPQGFFPQHVADQHVSSRSLDFTHVSPLQIIIKDMQASLISCRLIFVCDEWLMQFVQFVAIIQ